MRLFPGARRRSAASAHPHRTVLVVLILVLAAAVAGPAAYAEGHHHKARHLKHRAHHVHHQITKVSGDIDDVSSRVLRLSNRLDAAVARLRAARIAQHRVQTRLRSARKVEARLRHQLSIAQVRLNRAVARVEVAQRRVESQRQKTRATVIGFATQGDPRLAAITSYLHSGSLSDLMMSSTGNDVIIGQETGVLRDLESAETELRTRETQVQSARDKVRTRKVAAQRTVVRVHGLVVKAVANKKRVKRLVSSTRRTRAAAVRAKHADLRRLHRLEAREARIKRRILAMTAGDGNRHVGSTHGMFLSPVRGTYITSPYGWRMHPIYHYWGLHDGDDLHAPCGTPELAIGPGKVIQQYFSDVWGHRLYLDLGKINGHGYVAIYNHISAYRSHVGERVSSGETVALAGTTGWSTACHLHFTLMRDGRTVDPAPYIGLG